LNCLDNSMQKVRIKKENAPALSDRADALPVNHFKASYGSIFHAVGIMSVKYDVIFTTKAMVHNVILIGNLGQTQTSDAHRTASQSFMPLV
ncbi:MAG: hypothetical protein OIF56_04935, partial [Cohaesibacter sp.]|nr:hypothetical protein [Cohaesibacter sp.]